MIGLTSLKIYKSFFNKTDENDKIELYTENFDEFSMPELEVGLEEMFDVSIFSHEHIQGKTLGPRIIKANKKN